MNFEHIKLLQHILIELRRNLFAYLYELQFFTKLFITYVSNVLRHLNEDIKALSCLKIITI